MATTRNTNASTMHVYSTTDYSKFKTIDGNRNVNQAHIARLIKSMEEDYLISPIIVNESCEVIDGQHRLICAQQLGLPVYYIVCKGYGLSEIQRYNANSKNWTMDDFMNGYIELGKKEYEFYKIFKEKYGFAHSETLTMLIGNRDADITKMFQSGKLKIKNYNNACIQAEKIKLVEPYYEGWRRRGFVAALLHLDKNPHFSIEEFVDKLKFQRHKMYDCSTTTEYIEVIEEIYNFKRRGQKVSFKYAA